MAATTPMARVSAIPLRGRATAVVVMATFVGFVSFFWPFVVAPNHFGRSYTPLLMFGVLLSLVLAVLFAEVATGGIDAKAIAMLGVLSAIGAALRPLDAGTAGIEFIFFILILAGRVFGPGFGFALGCTTLFGSALITAGVLLIQWLIARRAAVFAYHGLPEQRSARTLWAGCVVPLANLLWAPVYVIELAAMEAHYSRLRRPITEWWIAWVFSYLASITAMITSFATDAQGIANNTALMVFAYLLAAATVAAAARVFEAFVRKPVARPAHRWVVVSPDRPAAPAPARPVELEGQEPAA